MQTSNSTAQVEKTQSTEDKEKEKSHSVHLSCTSLRVKIKDLTRTAYTFSIVQLPLIGS